MITAHPKDPAASLIPSFSQVAATWHLVVKSLSLYTTKTVPHWKPLSISWYFGYEFHMIPTVLTSFFKNDRYFYFVFEHTIFVLSNLKESQIIQHKKGWMYLRSDSNCDAGVVSRVGRGIQVQGHAQSIRDAHPPPQPPRQCSTCTLIVLCSMFRPVNTIYSRIVSRY